MAETTGCGAAEDNLPGGVERRTRERRSGDRRGAVDRRTGPERRRGPGRRRADVARAAALGEELTDEEFEFVMAIHEYKRVNRRPFPTWTEVLDIVTALGYRKVAEPEEFC